MIHVLILGRGTAFGSTRFVIFIATFYVPFRRTLFSAHVTTRPPTALTLRALCNSGVDVVHNMEYIAKKYRTGGISSAIILDTVSLGDNHGDNNLFLPCGSRTVLLLSAGCAVHPRPSTLSSTVHCTVPGSLVSLRRSAPPLVDLSLVALARTLEAPLGGHPRRLAAAIVGQVDEQRRGLERRRGHRRPIGEVSEGRV